MMDRKLIIFACLIEVSFLIFLQYRYNNVLDGISFIGVLVFFMVLSYFLSKKRKEIALFSQTLSLIFILIYVITTLPQYTYESAVDKVTQNLEEPYVINKQKNTLIKNESNEIKKGYMFSVVKNSKVNSYVFDPWTGIYHEVRD
ncbi:hypothetical protein [Paenibacillus amylolyticus]|uniref:hypothetical protein n=1 Tax=Paenibacillus amylolyticus TaxID=1451 RepID=UPI00249CC4C8|nr:hypothetical protein [Paenibacillus amylolyticus]WFA82698.1 hypothetical protein OGI70_16695 [Paenibacillus amylolyticus]